MKELSYLRQQLKTLVIGQLGLESRVTNIFSNEVATMQQTHDILSLPVDPTYQTRLQDATGATVFIYGVSAYGLSPFGAPGAGRTQP